MYLTVERCIKSLRQSIIRPLVTLRQRGRPAALPSRVPVRQVNDRSTLYTAPNPSSGKRPMERTSSTGPNCKLANMEHAWCKPHFVKMTVKIIGYRCKSVNIRSRPNDENVCCFPSVFYRTTEVDKCNHGTGYQIPVFQFISSFIAINITVSCTPKQIHYVMSREFLQRVLDS
jgi:hypothetical protein